MSEVQEKKQVKVSDVLAMLKEGKTREEIAAHYDVSMAEAKKDIFSHEKIKNKKTHRPSRVTLIDDVPEVQVVDDTVCVTTGEATTEETTADVVASEEVNHAEYPATPGESFTDAEVSTEEKVEQQEPAMENAAVEGNGEPETASGTW